VPLSPLLDPDALQRAEQLGVQARSIVEGCLAGRHRTPAGGFTGEFAQHREYVSGDDPRNLDWKVFGRRDRYYIRQYAQETHCEAHLLVDASPSMKYGSSAMTKFSHARTMAACLAYLILLQRDAVTLRILDTMLRVGSLPEVHKICAALTAAQPRETTAISAVLDEVAFQVKRRGIVILISDLLDDEEKILRGIRHLRFNGHDVVVVHVLDPYELEFPFRGAVEFHGLEMQEFIAGRADEIRRTYLAEFGSYLDRIRRGCEEQGCQYLRVRTDRKWADVLTAFLGTRLHRYG
jgi:uncharacterized protein (DUF58 family)